MQGVLMAEADVTAPEATEPLVAEVTAVAPAAPLEAHDDPDTEPGGNTPQEIRARKEYRLRKRLENELFDLQQERAATNARLRTLEEVTKPQPQKSPVYTNAQLQAAVDAGTITTVEAMDYMAGQRAQQTADRVVAQENERYDEANRQAIAQTQIDKYMEVAPWLSDKYDPRYKPLEAEYDRLISPTGLYRMPDATTTKALLLEKMFGNVATFAAKTKLATSSRASVDSHVESGAGGSGSLPTPRADGKVDLSKMPKHLVEFWDKSSTSQKEREKEAALYIKLRGQPK